MKKFIAFVYTQYVYDENFDIFTKVGKIFMYPIWFVRAIMIWIISPIFIPIFFIRQSEWYKRVEVLIDSPEFQQRMQQSMQKHSKK